MSGRPSPSSVDRDVALRAHLLAAEELQVREAASIVPVDDERVPAAGPHGRALGRPDPEDVAARSPVRDRVANVGASRQPGQRESDLWLSRIFVSVNVTLTSYRIPGVVVPRAAWLEA